MTLAAAHGVPSTGDLAAAAGGESGKLRTRARRLDFTSDAARSRRRGECIARHRDRVYAPLGIIETLPAASAADARPLAADHLRPERI